MNVEEIFYDTLKTTASGGCYPILAKEGASAPFIVYQRIDAPREIALNKTTRAANLQILVKCYGRTHQECASLAGSVRAAVDARADLIAQLVDDMVFYEDITQLFSFDLTYSCWENG